MGYFIALPFIYLISVLPFTVLYLLSDVLYVLFYHLIGYRKKVVWDNLRNSFPEKTDAEIEHIRRKFYRYFCDLLLESLKLLTISPEELKKHLSYTEQTIEIFRHYYEKKQSIILVMGHMGNWEMVGASFNQFLPFHRLYIIYHPLSNKRFDQLVYNMRARFDNGLYAMNEAFKGMLKDRDKLTATVFLSDQTPSPEGAYWTTFLSQETPVFNGTEKLAKKLNYPVVYASIFRPQRGLYTINTEIMAAEPKNYSENEISEMHTRRLELDIRQQPEIWLWTHRRWKHKRQG